MDGQYLARFEERSAYEANRSGPPEGFPKLPDLPLGRYTDPGFHALEQEFLWRRSWLYAAHDSRAAGPGSYKLCDIAGAADPARARRRWRGPGLLQRLPPSGAPRRARARAGRPGCSCASSTPGATTSTVARPGSRRARLRRAATGASAACRPVRCERWGGWYFVNLDDDAEPLLDWLAPLPDACLERSPRRRCASSTPRPCRLRCNWKILAEGFLEVYHARTIHPKTVAPTLDTRGTVITLYDHGHQSMVSPVNPGHATRRPRAPAHVRGRPRGVPAQHAARARHLPEPHHPARRPGLPVPRVLARGHRPDPARHHLVRARLGRRPHAQCRQGDLGPSPGPASTASWTRTTQTWSRSSGRWSHAAHGGQVVNYQERRIWHVHAWIDKVIAAGAGPDAIPAHLRVPDMLADWVEHHAASAGSST